MYKKSIAFIFVMLLLLISCDNGGQQVIFGTVELKPNSIMGVYLYPGQETEISVEISEDIKNKDYTLYWKEGDGEYVVSTETNKKFGPFNDIGTYPVSVKVTFGANEIIEELDIHIGSPVYWNGALSVSGTNIVNEHGKAIQLRGMSTHGLQYFDSLYSENAVKSLAEDWHADIIRISCYVNEGWGDHGNYLKQPQYWRDRVDTIVGWASKYGIYALIDWHQLVPGDPNAFLSEATAFWTYMAEKHGNKKNVLFDICNEPNNDSTYDANWNSISYKNGVSWSRIKEYADKIVPIIREKSDNIIIIGTPQWASRPDLVSGNTVDSKNIMYTMHFYAADHQAYLNNVKRAISSGIPVFVTEFGTQAADGDQGNNFDESKKWLDYLNEKKISWCNWNFSNDFRSGAVFKKNTVLETQSDFSNISNLKEAGLWIRERLNYEVDDF